MTEHEQLLAILREELLPIAEARKNRKAYRKITIIDGRIEPNHKPRRIKGEGIPRTHYKPLPQEDPPRAKPAPVPPSKLNLAIARYLARPKRSEELEEINAFRLAAGLKPLTELPDGL